MAHNGMRAAAAIRNEAWFSRLWPKAEVGRRRCNVRSITNRGQIDVTFGCGF